MKIAICSDLHLEFGPITLENKEGADVLVLSGDILVENDLDGWNEEAADNGYARKRSVMFHTFMQECAAAFKHVVYVAGNHEHYHGDYAKTLKGLKAKFSYLPNVHILDREFVTIDDVTFIGGTLWTDMNKEDALTLYHIRAMMNDFRIVRNTNRVVHFKDTEGKFHTREAKLCPEDVVEEHKAMVEFIRHVIEGRFEDKFVVCGHHAPSKLSTKPRYKDDVLMNGGYSSDLSDFIIDHPQIKLWTHGHTHDTFDYMVGSTRVVCNPRGYIGYEDSADIFELKVVEV